MGIGAIILIIISVVIFIGCLVFSMLDSDFSTMIIGLPILIFGIGIVIMSTSVSVPTGTVALEKDYGGRYTGNVISDPGYHMFSVPMSHGLKNVDIRNDKTTVKVDVMKNEKYNVHASIEVVYDLESDKIVDLLSSNPNYKSTIISSVVKNTITSNNSLANKQELSEQEKQDIIDKLSVHGIKVTNIYMNSYRLTNTLNFQQNNN